MEASTDSQRGRTEPSTRLYLSEESISYAAPRLQKRFPLYHGVPKSGILCNFGVTSTVTSDTVWRSAKRIEEQRGSGMDTVLAFFFPLGNSGLDKLSLVGKREESSKKVNKEVLEQ